MKCRPQRLAHSRGALLVGLVGGLLLSQYLLRTPTSQRISGQEGFFRGLASPGLSDPHTDLANHAVSLVTGVLKLTQNKRRTFEAPGGMDHPWKGTVQKKPV